MDWLTVDPGETTGWALWRGTELVDGGQDPMQDFLDEVCDSCICVGGDYQHNGGRFVRNDERLGAIVCEDWALYPYRTASLAWDKCRTARAIGALEQFARQAHIPIILQPAKVKETGIAAGCEELYVTPRHENRHQNDAILHGVFYLATHEQKPPC